MVFVATLEHLQKAAHLDIAPDDRVELARAARDPARSVVNDARSGAPPAPPEATSRGTLRSAAMCGRNDPGPMPNCWSTAAAGPRSSWATAFRRFSTVTLPPLASFSARARSASIAVDKYASPVPRLPQAPQGGLGLAGHVRGGGPGAAEHLGHAGVAIQRARQEVNRLHLRVLALVGESLRAGDERLRVGGVTFEVNRLLGSHLWRTSVARASRAPAPRDPPPVRGIEWLSKRSRAKENEDDMAAEVKVYTTTICPYCFRAKAVLAKRGIAYQEIDVTSDPEKRDWLVKTTGRRTVPQIFIAGRSGDPGPGSDFELVKLDRSSELAKRVFGAPA